MCRWLAYSGSPILLDELLFKPEHSLIEQSRSARLGAETTNGDGHGLGLYEDGSDVPPTVVRSITPAWSDLNLRELAGHFRSRLFFAHIRASTGSAVQQTNCHPFRYGRWLWMHNGEIVDFDRLKRDLVFAVDPELYPAIQGSTDSEVMFFLALTFGLREDPPAAVERMVGFVERTGRRNGVEHPIQMTIATSDGERVWSFRYSSEKRSRSLFYSTEVRSLRQLHPEIFARERLSDDARLIVSEPLRDMPGAWNEVPESTYIVIEHGMHEVNPFRPTPPA
ncbi:class II glutamine amidotransferase [Actinoallomurus sp. NPDC050550]|uniref:class II glutamine amidotransferase n=1 Tax=Actinoallomurus sp. NPDC050550 TaxID=3154937 RepID=UPI0033FC0252